MTKKNTNYGLCYGSGPDPDLCGRIRILALINGPISTFLVRVRKAINTRTLGISVV
jgi:hypothetical protein